MDAQYLTKQSLKRRKGQEQRGRLLRKQQAYDSMLNALKTALCWQDKLPDYVAREIKTAHDLGDANGA